jgi:RNA polymerase sigma-70 factor (ECF subfamily)
MQLIKQRDPEALAELYDRYAQIVYNLIFRLLSDPAIAGEILQETFWEVWQGIDKFPGQEPASIRLYRLARAKSLNQLYHQKAGFLKNSNK